MEKVLLIKPVCTLAGLNKRLEWVVDSVMKDYSYELVETADQLNKTNCKRCKVIFALNLGQQGVNLEYYKMIHVIRGNEDMFEGSVGGLIVDSNTELFTKSTACQMVFAANRSGLAFVGGPLVEGTGTLNNFNIIAKNLELDNQGAYLQSFRLLVERVHGYEKTFVENPKLLVLHAGNPKKSNTLALWNLVKKGITSAETMEISLRDGEIRDCIGCDYETCLHFGERQLCFYGGVITRDIYPALLKCDGVVMLCANYNDSMNAHMSAFINRLTSIFRVHRFYEKKVFGVVVSGYSGSDILAKQIIAGLNMNKTFFLPPRFSLLETANDPGSIYKKPNIEERAIEFGEKISNEFKTCQ